MYESERKDWINEYGYNEGYTYKEIRMSLTGHLWYGSAIETDNTCGNCDGGNCDSCRERYEVTLYGAPYPKVNEYGWTEWWKPTLDQKWFFDKDEALAYYEGL